MSEITRVYCALCNKKIKRGDGGKINQLPKGNMLSAIPVALLCMIVSLSEGKQGSGPKWDEVL